MTSGIARAARVAPAITSTGMRAGRSAGSRPAGTACARRSAPRRRDRHGWSSSSPSGRTVKPRSAEHMGRCGVYASPMVNGRREADNRLPAAAGETHGPRPPLRAQGHRLRALPLPALAACRGELHRGRVRRGDVGRRRDRDPDRDRHHADLPVRLRLSAVDRPVAAPLHVPALGWGRTSCRCVPLLRPFRIFRMVAVAREARVVGRERLLEDIWVSRASTTFLFDDLPRDRRGGVCRMAEYYVEQGVPMRISPPPATRSGGAS